MDLDKLLRDCYHRKDLLERAIALLEEVVLPDVHPKKKRGRKFMAASERREVSERMKRYWAARRTRSDR